jgi:hypothetical protein
MISVASEAGCRPGELLSLRIKHVKFDQIGAIISVDGKTGANLSGITYTGCVGESIGTPSTGTLPICMPDP